MRFVSNALFNTIGAIRKYALACSVLAFAIMGLLIGIKAYVFNQGASKLSLIETSLDISRSIFEAIGSALLVGALGSGLIDQRQKATVAAMQIAEK
jgi:hypothetical protein